MLVPESRLTSMPEEIALATRSPRPLGRGRITKTDNTGRPGSGTARDRDRPTTTKGETHEHDNVRHAL
jgi:hypothetical protein